MCVCADLKALKPDKNLSVNKQCSTPLITSGSDVESTQESQPAANDKFESPCDLSCASSSGTSCSLALPNETGSMVVYVINGTIIAGGHVQPEHDTIHGSRIPQDHLSVMITTTKPNHAAPLVLGDESENSFLEEGKFFALPIANIMRAML